MDYSVRIRCAVLVASNVERLNTRAVYIAQIISDEYRYIYIYIRVAEESEYIYLLLLDDLASPLCFYICSRVILCCRSW